VEKLGVDAPIDGGGPGIDGGAIAGGCGGFTLAICGGGGSKGVPGSVMPSETFFAFWGSPAHSENPAAAGVGGICIGGGGRALTGLGAGVGSSPNPTAPSNGLMSSSFNVNAISYLPA